MRKNKFLIIGGILVAILALIFVFKTASIYPVLFHLIFDKGISLKETNSKVNILLLGIGGGSHDGPNLTDTIILANIDPKENKVTLVSIPRDLWMPDLTSANKKINGAYAYGESIRKGGGLTLAEAVVGKVTGQEISYAIRIDFSGFVKAVNIIDGLDIDIDNTFDDYEYPISGKEDDSCSYTDEDIREFSATSPAELDIQEKFKCRYMHVHFDKGLNHMNGDQALEYVRSRHAIGVESGDFARSKRQEKVINSFRDKVVSAQTLIDPGKLLNLYNIIKDSIDTNIKQDDFDDFIRLAGKLKNAKIQSAVIDIGDATTQRNGLLIEDAILSDGLYLSALTPRMGNGNFSEIQDYISCQILKGNCLVNAKLAN